LVLIEDESDITVAFITTQVEWRETGDMLLLPNTQNGLKYESLVRLNKLATIEKSLVLGELGNLNDHEMIEVDQKLIMIF
jgi:mRNA interferase MazF